MVALFGRALTREKKTRKAFKRAREYGTGAFMLVKLYDATGYHLGKLQWLDTVAARSRALQLNPY
jgi:hypothetical protein